MHSTSLVCRLSSSTASRPLASRSCRRIPRILAVQSPFHFSRSPYSLRSGSNLPFHRRSMSSWISTPFVPAISTTRGIGPAPLSHACSSTFFAGLSALFSSCFVLSFRIPRTAATGRHRRSIVHPPSLVRASSSRIRACAASSIAGMSDTTSTARWALGAVPMTPARNASPRVGRRTGFDLSPVVTSVSSVRLCRALSRVPIVFTAWSRVELRSDRGPRRRSALASGASNSTGSLPFGPASLPPSGSSHSARSILFQIWKNSTRRRGSPTCSPYPAPRP